MTELVTESLKIIQGIFIEIDKRAERASAEILDATFVDSAPLYDLLATRNNQVIYGRRGTGKTHALKYLAKQIANKKELPLYLDLRSVGSNGSIYGDTNRTFVERASTLIRDVLQSLLDGLYEAAVVEVVSALDPKQISLRLDDLQNSISEVKVSGQVEHESTSADQGKSGKELGIDAKLWPAPSLNVLAKFAKEHTSSETTRFKQSGSETLHLNFGRVSTALAGLIAVLNINRVWLLLDEWSEIPIDLQPYLADLIRRTILPQNAITIKIAAIEHRSQFAIRKGRGEYIGVELGADVAADLNLDDFLVFESDQVKAVNFFKLLLFKHFKAAVNAPIYINTPDSLVQVLFTQYTVFEEFVRAVEGVPRDALNLVTRMVTRAHGHKITMQHVRGAARDWYTQDKARDVNDSPALGQLLTHIIDEVIGLRRARAFLFNANIRNVQIGELFDSRILHILKKSISTHDEPGVRYDVYKIDYGCYVELINTSRAPQGLYQVEDQFIEVPKDDHRSIRRAILRIEDLRPQSDI